jgi:hypothetical protein
MDDDPTTRFTDANEPTQEDRLYFIILRLVEEWCCGQDNEDIDFSFVGAIGELEGAGYLAYEQRDVPTEGQMFITETGRQFAAWFERQTRKRVSARIDRWAQMAVSLFPGGPPFTREQVELIERALRGDA